MSVFNKVTNEREAIERMVAWWVLAILMLVAAFWVGVGIVVWALVKGWIL